MAQDAALTSRLQLVIPGLLGSVTDEPDAGDRPALETLLTRAERGALATRGFEPLLFSLVGAEVAAEGDLPVGAVTRVLDLGVVDNGWWLRADPVNLNPQRDQLILSDNYLLDLTQDEATRLAAEIGELYAPDGWVVKAPRPSRWYIKPARAPKIATTPLTDVVGHDIHPYLPRGPEAKAWHTILNETQIVLHSSKVNEERERAGKLPVNSLWFWGGGRLPRIKSAGHAGEQPDGWHGIWSNEPASLALARLADVATYSTPAGFGDWQRQAAAAGTHMIVLDTLRAPLLYRDADAWLKALNELERNWFTPLFAALKSRAIESVSLLTDTGQSFRLTPGLARRWWRLRKPLATFR